MILPVVMLFVFNLCDAGFDFNQLLSEKCNYGTRMLDNANNDVFEHYNMTSSNPSNNLTAFTRCFWPKVHDLGNSFKMLMSQGKDVDCLVPPKSLQNLIAVLIENFRYKFSKVAKRFPKVECGSCGRKVRCCRSNSFLRQSYDSSPCQSSPCKVQVLSRSDWRYIRALFPEWRVQVPKEPNCNFNEIIQNVILKNSRSSLLQRLMCQLTGKRIAKFNCEIDTDRSQCLCCCSGFKPAMTNSTNFSCELDEVTHDEC